MRVANKNELYGRHVDHERHRCENSQREYTKNGQRVVEVSLENQQNGQAH